MFQWIYHRNTKNTLHTAHIIQVTKGQGHQNSPQGPHLSTSLSTN